ncbi:hypothetical protein BWD13_03660 [Leptospira santarosai serovar Grippotyphosa]|nr:hypothetical protein BWD13_03660 [Leptospira santarosai serovar Grippotyphosa]
MIQYATGLPADLFPTYVGLNRFSHCGKIKNWPFPHMRGVEPGKTLDTRQNVFFSPHAWGYSIESFYKIESTNEL